ncbi:hypothetical protein E4T42_09128 [Aureobasidium subglaciale]|nr:hypothetical protein E4T42_09128 [Aureobasidium subglaciale]
MTQRANSTPASLTELAYLRRLQRYQHRKSDNIEHRLHWLETSCEARDRVLKGSNGLRHQLTEAIQSGDRNRFSLLFNTFHTLNQACDEWESQSAPSEASNIPVSDHRSSSFLEDVSPGTRDILMAFLSRISFDPTLLLDRLLDLKNSDFASLSRPYAHSPSSHLGFGSLPRRAADEAENEAIGSFLDFSRSDVLGLLLRLIPTGEHLQSGPLPNAWGLICAGLLSHQKPGSDKFVVTVLDAHLGQLDKTACHCLENWLLDTLRDGDFLLYQTDRQSFRNKAQVSSGQTGDDTKALEEFFAKAIGRLLLILKDNELTRVIPNSVLVLGRSIVAELEPSSQQQQAAPYFLCTRWLFASYLSSVITSPEVRGVVDEKFGLKLIVVQTFGLLLSHHIFSTSRQRILRELAHRARQMMEGVAYSWKQTSPIVPSIITNIECIVGLFRPVVQKPKKSSGLQQPDEPVTVCPLEIINAIRVLYPECGEDLYRSFHTVGGSTLRSSASSISGLSLFRTVSPSEPVSPRNGFCESVPEVGSSEILPSSGSALGDHCRDESCRSTIGDTFIQGLREACIELSVYTGHSSNAGTRDIFSEQWTSLEACPNRNATSWIHHADCQIRHTSELGTGIDIDLSTLDFLTTGIHTLLDGFMSVSTSHGDIAPQDNDISFTALIDQFEAARATCYHQGDFAKAHLFFRLAKTTTSLSPELTSQVTQTVAKEFRRSIDDLRLKVHNMGARIEKLNERIDLQKTEFKSISYIHDRLREKMWYTADIQQAGHYEDLRKVATALRVMATSTRPKSGKRKPLLRHRSASKSLNYSVQLKAEAATLDLMSAPVDKGGTNKLSDAQIETTLRWMELHGVEKICRAEERIHRFCSELTRCLDCFVGQSVVDNPILWSSQLFQNQKPLTGLVNDRVSTPSCERSALEQLRLMYSTKASSVYHEAPFSPQWGRVATPSRSTMDSNLAARSMSPRSVSHDYFGCRSPTLTHKSSGTLWSTFSAGPQSPSSATSHPSRALSPLSTTRPLSRHSCLQQNQASFLAELRQNLTSLLLSDFHDLFHSGSETDKAMRKPLKSKTSAINEPAEVMEYDYDTPQSSFDFDRVFCKLLRRFELQASPYTKLDVILELQSMLKAHRADLGLEDQLGAPPPNSALLSSRRLSLRIDASTAPRSSSGHDSTILSFRQLFQNPHMRPKTLFRDLQYIASLVPLHVLDSTPRGRAFWNATIAALDLKEEICQGMIETADQIVHHHTFNRGHSRVTSAAQAKRDAAAFSPSTPQPGDPSVADLCMSDAATLLQLTAKEGIPAAQRELATLYLTHPELLGICLSPFSKVKDVFKDIEKDREALSERYDPVAMAVAQHWMELSARGGDGPAARYLQARDEFDRIP